MRNLLILNALILPLLLSSRGFSFESDKNADRAALPTVPPEFEVKFFAKEPLVRQPCSMAFDAKGRLFVGMGPQYRNPTPTTPADSVVIVQDTDGDGVADKIKVFATGFNTIQAMAWRGRDLWIANAPDLTVVRDLDGDDEADEYVRIYTDLGNLEHALHGLNWAPDGKLYMSKGNSKGYSKPNDSSGLAPRAFMTLWHGKVHPDWPAFPEPVKFTKQNYKKAYHTPPDDQGREGGVLRCDDGGMLSIDGQQVIKFMHTGVLKFLEQFAAEEAVCGHSSFNFLPEAHISSRGDFFIVDGDGLIHNQPGGVHEMGNLLPSLKEAAAGGQKKVVGLIREGRSFHDLNTFELQKEGRVILVNPL